MGTQIRTPRPIYKDKVVVDFKTKNKIVYYIIYKWNDDGSIRSDIEKGKLGDRTRQQMLDYALQKFTNVEVESCN